MGVPDASESPNSQGQVLVRKALLIEKVSPEKMGYLVVPQIQLKKVQSSGLCYVKGRVIGRCKK